MLAIRFIGSVFILLIGSCELDINDDFAFIYDYECNCESDFSKLLSSEEIDKY